MTENQENNIVNQETYTYTYSASQQEEIEAIRRKYLPNEKKTEAQDALSRLKRIEKRVENVGTVSALVIGIVGILLLGIAMCCVLVWMGVWFFVGIPVGLVGIGLMVSAYPVYRLSTRVMRQKYAPKVLKLTEDV